MITKTKLASLCAFALALSLALPPLSAQAQVGEGRSSSASASDASLTVTGHVQDVSGIAMVGVAVTQTGTRNTVLSNEMGDFTINVSDPASAQLEFLFFGMKTVTLAAAPGMIVTMEEAPLTLDQVIVTGYSSVSKEAYTGSAVTVTSDKLEDRAIASLEEAFRGNVVGSLSTSSGQPGDPGSILLRGFGSMNASNQPLFVVDGVVWDQVNMSGSDNTVSNPLNSLNPSDIASFTVLKDAASASLYGSRGANGVVVITTKKGNLNENIRVNFSTVNGISYMTGNPSLTNGAEYTELWVEGQMNALIQSRISQETSGSAAIRSQLIEELKYLYGDKTGYTFDGKNFYEWQKLAREDFNAKYKMPATNGGYTDYDYFCDDSAKLPSTDWFRQISRVAPFTKTSLSVRGGGSYVNYYASLEYFNQQGTIIKSQLERYAMRVRLNSDAKDRIFNWGINTYLAYTMQSGPNAGGALYNAPQYAAVILPSVIPAYLEDGSYNYTFPDNLLNSNHNPVASAKLNLNLRPAINVNITGDIAFKITDWLRLTSKASLYYYGYRRKAYYNSEFGSGYSTNGSLTERDVHRRKISSTTMFNVNKSWRAGHTLSASAGVELEDLKYTFTNVNAQNFGTDNLPYLSNSSNIASYEGDGYGYGLFSIITRADYSYKSKYLFGASYRRDYSSMFSREHRGGNFWSVSAGYDLAKEQFMRKVRRNVNQLKIKASYGVNGTLPSQYYAWQDLYSSVRYTNEFGVYSASRYCENLTWEQNNVWNVGIDASFFRNRLDIGIEYYNRVSSNLLQDVNVSMASGYQTMLMNTGAGIRNNGLEVTVNGTAVRKGKWQWDLGFNLTWLKSVYYGFDTQYLDSYQRQIVANGYNVNTWYLREYAGIDPDTGACLYYAEDEDGTIYKTTSAGSAPYRTDKQGVPKVLGGINTTLKWNGLQLEMLFVYGLGHYIYDRMGASIIANDGATNYSIAKSQLDRWNPDNMMANNPLRINGSPLSTRSTRYLYKGDYLKMKNVKLSYSFPRELISKAKMSALSLYLQAENPFVLGYLGDYDPEMSITGYRYADLYPTASTYTLGLNIRF